MWNIKVCHLKKIFKLMIACFKKIKCRLWETAVRALIEVMIFNSWVIVYGTDGTLDIAETIIDSFCFLPPLLDSKAWNTFYPRQEFFSFQLQRISKKQLFYCIFHTSLQVTWVLAPLFLIKVGFPRFEIIVLGKSYSGY